MADREGVRLRRLAAELRAELRRVARTVDEARAAGPALAGEPERLAVYGAAALLETFYTGVEKMLWRVAATLEDPPEGATWHRALLERMVVAVPKVRPAVLGEETAARLETYLAFRHRFRNLYLFDLRLDLIRSLLEDLPGVWDAARSEVEAFAGALEAMADAVG